MEVKKFEEGILFGEKVFFSKGEKILADKINLKASCGPHIMKQPFKEFVINYPGEYEKYNIYIKCIKGDTDRLNYFIQDYNLKENYAFIQDPSVLENLDLTIYPEKWYFEDEIIEKQIERLGFEGEIFKI